MKITVNKYLNARKGTASTSAACSFYQSPGNTITIDEVVAGDELDGNSIWYHCVEDGCFYWSGGIEEVDFEIIKLSDFTGNKDVILTEAIKYFWNNWKENIDGFTGAFAGDKIKGGVISQNDTIVFQVLVKSGNLTQIMNAVPATITYKGFVIETDVIQASFARFEIAKPGDSVSRINEINEWGTVALKVQRKNENKSYLLTNYHVAGFDLLLQNQLIYKFPPDIANRQVMVPNQKSAPSNTVFIGAFSEGRLTAHYDIGLVLLNNGNAATNDVDGFTIKEYINIYDGADNYIGKAVTLYGASSGKKNNPIISIHSHQVFNYNAVNKIELLELLQVSKFSSAGDSGSPVLLNNKIIGIHVGSDDQFSYAIPIKRVLDFYNLKISQS